MPHSKGRSLAPSALYQAWTLVGLPRASIYGMSCWDPIRSGSPPGSQSKVQPSTGSRKDAPYQKKSPRNAIVFHGHVTSQTNVWNSWEWLVVVLCGCRTPQEWLCIVWLSLLDQLLEESCLPRILENLGYLDVVEDLCRALQRCSCARLCRRLSLLVVLVVTAFMIVWLLIASLLWKTVLRLWNLWYFWASIMINLVIVNIITWFTFSEHPNI